MANQQSKTKVVQKPNVEPIGVEIIAQDIQAIADSMAKINGTRLTRKAIVVLIQANSGLPKSTIELVLNNLDSLAFNYLKRI